MSSIRHLKSQPKYIITTVLLVAILMLIVYGVGTLQMQAPSKITSVVKDSGSIQVHFCPDQNCEEEFINFLNSAESSIHCALFDVGLESIQNVLDTKSTQIDVKIVTDNTYTHKFNRSFVQEDSWGLMHNKFCIVDNQKVLTGSMNPTNNGAHKNNNNLLLIESKTLASNYQAEFSELWQGEFKGGEQVTNPKIMLNSTLIQTAFCPEDNCAARVKKELEKAEHNIHFMTFSFTHEGIANILLLKAMDNVTIQGIMEARQVSKYSQFERLVNNGIDVIKDNNPNNMHHKVFIIDDHTVITGSFNPSQGGDTKNDENLLIIYDKEITRLFLEEFERLYTF